MKNTLFISVSLGILSAATAAAGPITLPLYTWEAEPFTLMPPGGLFPDAYQASVGGTVRITGYYVTGDYYQAFVNGTLALTTTQVGPLDVDYGDMTPPRYADPASAFSTGLFSTGQFRVNAGDVITIRDLYPPSGIGEVGVELVPEPASLALLALGLAGVVLFRRRSVRG